MNARIGTVCFVILILLDSAGFAQEKIHVVQKGDTIYSLARSYGTDPEALLALNRIEDPRKIQAGQRLRIPASPEGSSVEGPFIPITPPVQPPMEDTLGVGEYQAARGDSLYGIARRFGITVEELREANAFGEDYILWEGEILMIPQREGEPAPDFVPVSDHTPVQETFVPEGQGNSSPRSMVSGPLDSSVEWPIAAREMMYMTGKLYGVILLGERSEQVKSLTPGTVVSAGPYRGFGKVAIVQVAGGYLYVYGGCESLSVQEGDKVAPGTPLGALGIDGVSLKPQLFFLVFKGGDPLDPAKAPRF